MALLALFAIAASIGGGTPTITWYAVDTGGSLTMTGSGPGGAVEILGTLGQPSISSPMTGTGPGGAVEIIGGFLTAALPGDQIWIGGSSGSFTDPMNWDDGLLPGPFDSVYFDVNTALMNISFPANVQFGRLLVLDSIVRFNFQNTDCTLNDPSTSLPSLIIARDNDVAELRLENFLSGAGRHGLHARSVSIGDGVLSDGTLRVTGPNTSFTCMGEFTVGRRGYGEFRVENQGLASTQGPVWVGRQAGSEGRVVIDGAGALWTAQSTASGHDFIVGESGMGIVQVSNGAIMETTTSDEVVLGLNPGSFGHVIVNGMGSLWREMQASLLNIGESETSRLTLVNDGRVEWNTDDPSSIVVVSPRGELEGVGALAGDVISLGGVAPGQATVDALARARAVRGGARGARSAGPITTGTLRIEGDYEQIQTAGEDDTGNLYIRVAATGGASRTSGGGTSGAGGITADRLEVTGTARLGGGLFIVVDASVSDPSMIPPLQLLTAATISTANPNFDVAILPGLAHPHYMQVGYAALVTGGDAVTVLIGELNQEMTFGLPEGLQLDGDPVDGVTGDFDGDGDTDLAIGLPGNPGGIRVLRNNGMGVFPTQQHTVTDAGNGPAALTGGDFDGDGDVDLAVVNAGDVQVQIFVNGGPTPPNLPLIFTAGLTFNVGDQPSDIATGRLNGDALLDLVVTNEGSDSVQVLLQTAGGGEDFSIGAPVSTMVDAPGPHRVALGMIDTPPGGGGSLDVVILSPEASRIAVLRNDGAGVLGLPGTVHSYAVDDSPNALVVGDMNFDGLADVITTNDTPGDPLGDTVSVLVNRWADSGGLAPAVHVPAATSARAAVLADLDGDAMTDLDLAVLTGAGTASLVQVFRNDSEGADGSVGLTLDEEVPLGVAAVSLLVGEIDGDPGQDLISLNVGGAGPGGGVEELTLVRNTTPPPCPADCAASQDGQVNVTDLLALLAQWNTAGACDIAPPPSGNGVVNVSDLLALLAAWGACP
jgi:T5SS/PEP-CTERM-associated repeat protein